MLSQLANLQGFVNSKLSDVINWQQHVRPANDIMTKTWLERDYQRETTGDRAYIAIKTPFNAFWMSSLGTYVEPPAGAPTECRSLGTIARNDATFHKIAEHVRTRELIENIKDTRRQLAENPPTPQLKSKWDTLLIKAKERGLDITSFDSNFKMPDMAVINSELAERNAPLPHAAVTDAKDPDGLYVGCPVLFITNPGEHISGMFEIPGIVTKTHGQGRIAGIFFPDHSEVMHRDYVYHRTGPIKSNCWDFNPWYKEQIFATNARYAELDQRMRAIEEMAVSNEPMATEKALIAEVAKLEKRIVEIDRAAGAQNAQLREGLDKLKDTVLEIMTRPAEGASVRPRK